MSIYIDDYYNNLDELSQLIMPYVFSANDVLLTLPDEINIDFNKIKEIANTDKSICLFEDLPDHIKAPVNEFYQIDDGEFNLDVANNVFPFIKYKKCAPQMNEKYMFNWVKKYALSKSIIQTYHMHLKSELKRYKELLELFDIEGQELCPVDIAKTCNIRSIDLMLNVVDWMCSYIMNANIPAMYNLKYIKALMRSGRPIYSIRSK